MTGLSSKASSGTSAGAMNAVVVADGLDTGGKEGARQALEKFWSGVSTRPGYIRLSNGRGSDRLLGRWTLDFSPGYIFFDTLSRDAITLPTKSPEPQSAARSHLRSGGFRACPTLRRH